MALDTNGYVWTWGQGANGRLGHGSSSIELAPRKIIAEGFADIKLISGGMHSLAVDSQGRIWAWGNARWLGHG